VLKYAAVLYGALWRYLASDTITHGNHKYIDNPLPQHLQEAKAADGQTESVSTVPMCGLCALFELPTPNHREEIVSNSYQCHDLGGGRQHIWGG
jgi:hypothetical protein